MLNCLGSEDEKSVWRKVSVDDKDIASNSGGDELEYSGWVYHLGVNLIGSDNRQLRFLTIRGKYVELYKRDPYENPGLKPIKRAVIGPTLVLEELGRQRFNYGDLYVLRFYNCLDESKKGEIGCATAGEARSWRDAFEHNKQMAEDEFTRNKQNAEKWNFMYQFW